MARTLKSPRSPEQVAKDGFAALIQGLGLVDAIRFVQLTSPTAGDYTRSRQKWADDLSHDRIVELMEQTQKPSRRRSG